MSSVVSWRVAGAADETICSGRCHHRHGRIQASPAEATVTTGHRRDAYTRTYFTASGRGPSPPSRHHVCRSARALGGFPPSRSHASPHPRPPHWGWRDTISTPSTTVTRPYLHARMIVHGRLDGGGSGGGGPLRRVRGFHTTIPWYQSVVHNCSATAACKSSDGSVRHETTCKRSSNTGTNIASNTKKMTVRVRQSSQRRERERERESEWERVSEWLNEWVREHATGDGRCVCVYGREGADAAESTKNKILYTNAHIYTISRAVCALWRTVVSRRRRDPTSSDADTTELPPCWPDCTPRRWRYAAPGWPTDGDLGPPLPIGASVIRGNPAEQRPSWRKKLTCRRTANRDPLGQRVA